METRGYLTNADAIAYLQTKDPNEAVPAKDELVAELYRARIADTGGLERIAVALERANELAERRDLLLRAYIGTMTNAVAAHFGVTLPSQQGSAAKS